MFRLTLFLNPNTVPADGFVAIDFRRRHGLPDSPKVCVSGNLGYGFDVDEGFARMWFGGSITGCADISLDWLVPGELKLGYDNAVTLNLDDTARAKDLFVKAEFEKMREKLNND